MGKSRNREIPPQLWRQPHNGTVSGVSQAQAIVPKWKEWVAREQEVLRFRVCK